MIVNNDVKRGGAVNPVQSNQAPNGPVQNWKAPVSQGTPPLEDRKGKIIVVY